MDNKELDKWLAENVMGWKLNIMQTPYYKYWLQGITYRFYIDYWAPTEKIEQAFMCEDKLDPDQQIKYEDELRRVIRGNRSEEVYLFELIHASAEQRCKAIYNTLSK